MKLALARAAQVVMLVALSCASAGAVDVDNLAAKKMKIKDNVDAEKRKIQLVVKDPAIAASDGYANASITHAEFVAYGSTTGEAATWTSETCVGDGIDKLTCGKEISISPGKLKVKVNPLSDRRFNLDGLANQMPVNMVVRVHSSDDSTSVYYCAICGNLGTDVEKKTGTDGKSVVVTNCDASPCGALNVGGCCSDGNYCNAGGDADPFVCLTSGTQFLPGGGEAGPIDSVCDHSGTCVWLPGAASDCCEFEGSLCATKFVSVNCAAAGGTHSYPGVCHSNGSCVP
jgi:hypothetical protein